MTLLTSHLEQISLSSKSIAELQFPPRKIFTNALLSTQEITTLIRDTEPHERSLFSVDPNAVNRSREQKIARHSGIENGSHGRKSLFLTAHSKKQSAITRLLGNEMLQEIRQSSGNTTQPRDGVNIEVLLRGAEKLCDVYTIAGATEKIHALRRRHGEVAASISSLEDKVARQQSLLDRRNKGLDSEEEAGEDDVAGGFMANETPVAFTEEDFQIEEDEIRELEAKKKALEDRVSGMERDLGGLLG